MSCPSIYNIHENFQSVRLAQEKEEKPVKRELEESEDDEEDEPLSARLAFTLNPYSPKKDES